MHKPNVSCWSGVVGFFCLFFCGFFFNKTPLRIKSCLENTSSAILSLCQTCPPSVLVHELCWKIFLLAGWSFTEPGSSPPTRALNQPQTLQGTPRNSRHPNRASLRRVHPRTSSQLRHPGSGFAMNLTFSESQRGRAALQRAWPRGLAAGSELLSNHSRS